MTSLKTMLAAAMTWGAASIAQAEEPNHNVFVLVDNITGPFNASQDCVEKVMKSILGSVARVTPKYPKDSDNIYIDGYSLPQGFNSPRQIFVTLNNGQVTQLGVNFDGTNREFYGWADIAYGQTRSTIKIGGPQPMGGIPASEVQEYITRVDGALRSCGSMVAAPPALNAG